ncbi:MAG: response regulator [Acidimicrobiales bacterium]
MTVPRVLAVDDEPDIRLLIELLLGQAGYDVETVGTGEAAIHRIADSVPDLLLLDIFLPGMSGWDVAIDLQAQGLLPALPILMLSAHADPHAGDRAKALGCRGFLTKPFDPDSLVEQVEAVLEGAPPVP